MTPKPPKPGAWILVRWNDAHVDMDREVTPADASTAPVPCETLGHFVKEDAEGIVVCSDLLRWPEEVRYRTQNVIPRGMIVEVVRISRPRGPRKVGTVPSLPSRSNTARNVLDTNGSTPDTSS